MTTYNMKFNEIKEIMEEVDYDKLDGGQRKIYDTLKKALDEIDNVRKWKSYYQISKLVEKSKFNIFSGFLNMETDQILLSVDQALTHLGISNQTFKNSEGQDIGELITYIRIKAETALQSQYTILKDVQSPEKIGEMGQKIPIIFAELENKYPEPELSLPSHVVELMKRKNDIIDLLFASVETGMIYQASHDIIIRILMTQENAIKEKEAKKNELEKTIGELGLEKTNLEEEIEKLKIQKNIIEEENKQKELDEIQEILEPQNNIGENNKVEAVDGDVNYKKYEEDDEDEDEEDDDDDGVEEDDDDEEDDDE